MMTKVFEITRKELKDVKEVPAIISEMEDKVRNYNVMSKAGPFPGNSMKGILMTVLPTDVKTFMSQHSNLPWLEYRAKVLEFVYRATSGNALMLQNVEKDNKEAENAEQRQAEEWPAQGYGYSFDGYGVF